MEDRLYPNSDKVSDMSNNALGNGRFSNRAARFYWADDEPSPQRAYSIQQISKISSTDSHFEESPLVIASISAGVIGVAIIIVILVGIWIRSRLYSDEEGNGGGHPNNISVRSSMSTLDEDAYEVCVEMNGTVLGGMHNAVEKENECENNSIAIEMNEESVTAKTTPSICVPVEVKVSEDLSDISTPAANDHNESPVAANVLKTSKTQLE